MIEKPLGASIGAVEMLLMMLATTRTLSLGLKAEAVPSKTLTFSKNCRGLSGLIVFCRAFGQLFELRSPLTAGEEHQRTEGQQL